MRTCRAWRVVSPRERSPLEAERPNNDPWPLPPLVRSFAANVASGLIRPSRLSSLLGQGQGSLSGDGARAAQHPIPQQKPVSVPQQQVPDGSESTTRVRLSARTIIGVDKLVRPRLTIKLAVTSHRVVR